MSTLTEHARTELERLGQFDEDPAFAQSLIATVAAYASYGHSGGSHMVAVDMLAKLLNGENLAPLTSDPDEWEDRSDMHSAPLWQNRRNTKAMSNDGGKTYWLVDDKTAQIHYSQMQEGSVMSGG